MAGDANTDTAANAACGRGQISVETRQRAHVFPRQMRLRAMIVGVGRSSFFRVFAVARAPVSRYTREGKCVLWEVFGREREREREKGARIFRRSAVYAQGNIPFRPAYRNYLIRIFCFRSGLLMLYRETSVSLNVMMKF